MTHLTVTSNDVEKLTIFNGNFAEWLAIVATVYLQDGEADSINCAIEMAIISYEEIARKELKCRNKKK